MGVEKDMGIERQGKKAKGGKGKKKSGGDYDGWILRLIDKVEDLAYSFNLQKWLDFAESKIMPKQKYHLTRQQAATLDDLREKVWEIAPTRLNIQLEYITRFRGARTGRFIQVRKTEHGFRDIKTGRFTKAVPEKAERYRNLGGYGQKVGTMVPAAKINAKINRDKAEKTWLKKEA